MPLTYGRREPVYGQEQPGSRRHVTPVAHSSGRAEQHLAPYSPPLPATPRQQRGWNSLPLTNQKPHPSTCSFAAEGIRAVMKVLLRIRRSVPGVKAHTNSYTTVDWVAYYCSAWARGTKGGRREAPAQPPLTQTERYTLSEIIL